MTRFFLTLPFIAVLTGCGTPESNSDVGYFHSGFEGKTTIADISTVAIVETGPAATSMEQQVSGYSCKNKIWEAAPSRDNAVALMKKEAAARGFTAIHSVKVYDDPVSVVKNCWSAIKAEGIAFNPPK